MLLDLSETSSSEVIESEGSSAAGMLDNFVANIANGTPLVAAAVEGIKSVR